MNRLDKLMLNIKRPKIGSLRLCSDFNIIISLIILTYFEFSDDIFQHGSDNATPLENGTFCENIYFLSRVNLAAMRGR